MKRSYALILVLAGMLLGCEPSPEPGKYNEGSEEDFLEKGALDGYTGMLIIANIMEGPEGPVRGPVAAIIIDMSGKEVHTYSSVIAGRMLPDGIMLGVEEIMPNGQSATSLIQETWDGTVEWTYSHWENVPGIGWCSRMHHDLQREGNPAGYYAPGQDFVEQGNTLVLAHADEIRPDISSKPLLDDIIYEIDWHGNHTPTMFEWHAVDHVFEFGFDKRALAAIDRIDGDWLHINSISRLGKNHWYNENGDSRFHPQNIILSSRHAGFLAIISHQSGEVVWRVGPDYSEGNREAVLEPLIGIHQAHMIPKGLPGEGNILVFDNGGASGWGGLILTRPMKYVRFYSRVVEFDPTTFEIVWEYSPQKGDYLPFSPVNSGVQRLPNGNTLITSGEPGHLLEVTPEKEIVWDYINNFFVRDSNSVFRATRYPPEWVPGNPAGYAPWEKYEY